MKKLIVMVIALSLASCKEDTKVSEGTEAAEPQTLKECQDRTVELEETVAKLKSVIGNKPEAQSFVILEKARISDLEDWLKTVVNDKSPAPNKINITNKDIITLESGGYYYVDLNLITKYREEIIADWLYKNGKYIKYHDSCWLIEVAHKVQEHADLNTLNNDTIIYKEVSWTDIKKIIDDEALADGSTDHFKRYIQVDVAASPVIKAVSYIPNPQVSLFSFPLFNSIVFNHPSPNDLKFFFAKSGYRGPAVTIMKVMDGNILIGYYDFTHRPNYTLTYTTY